MIVYQNKFILDLMIEDSGQYAGDTPEDLTDSHYCALLSFEGSQATLLDMVFLPTVLKFLDHFPEEYYGGVMKHGPWWGIAEELNSTRLRSVTRPYAIKRMDERIAKNIETPNREVNSQLLGQLRNHPFILRRVKGWEKKDFLNRLTTFFYNTAQLIQLAPFIDDLTYPRDSGNPALGTYTDPYIRLWIECMEPWFWFHREVEKL